MIIWYLCLAALIYHLGVAIGDMKACRRARRELYLTAYKDYNDYKRCTNDPNFKVMKYLEQFIITLRPLLSKSDIEYIRRKISDLD